MSGDHIVVTGQVVSCERDKFFIECENGQSVIGQLSGKLRKNNIRIYLGDKVTVKLSPYDLTNGIVVSREKR